MIRSRPSKSACVNGRPTILIAHVHRADERDGHRDHERDRRSSRTGSRPHASRRHEHVAAAADAADQHVGVVVAAELAAQIADVGVEAAVVGQQLPAERRARQRFARHDVARASASASRESRTRRSSASATVRRATLRGGADSRAACRRTISAGSSPSGFRRAAQDRLHAREQLARIERLRQIVVGAEIEPDDAIDVVAARREHQHRRLRAGSRSCFSTSKPDRPGNMTSRMMRS